MVISNVRDEFILFDVWLDGRSHPCFFVWLEEQG
jgi:hypothetical protein